MTDILKTSRRSFLSLIGLAPLAAMGKPVSGGTTTTFPLAPANEFSELAAQTIKAPHNIATYNPLYARLHKNGMVKST